MENSSNLINQNINPIFEEIKELINISKNKVYNTINIEILVE